MLLTYQQAYNKIIDAYFKDEIIPMDNSFCFCGTLSPDAKWRESVDYPYSGKEYNKMENALFDGMLINERKIAQRLHPEYEKYLFNGMSAALDVLKEIHRSRGEDVDGEATPFIKRQLQTV